MTAIAVREPGWPPLAVAAAALLVLALLVPSTGPPVAAPTSAEGLAASIAEAPLSFEPNAGRTNRSVDFLAHSIAGGTLFLSSGEAVLALPPVKGDPAAVRMRFAGADPRTKARGLNPLPGRANAFAGDDPATWRSGIPTYGRVRYEQIYPGVDLDFYGNQRDLEYDFRLAPGADPSRLAIAVTGADSVRLGADGDLVLRAGTSTIRQQAPVAYQRVAGERRRVRAAYELSGSRVGFRVGRYDASRPLVIDPLVLAYSTYLGGGGTDIGNGISVDSAGAAYVTGETVSTDFPTEDPRDPDQPNTDAFVTKLDPDSDGPVTLAYSTYLGGDGIDVGNGIAVDSAGAAYVSGSTGSTDFPTQLQYQGDQGSIDVFVTKLNPDSGGAVTLSYSTYLGGGSAEGGNGTGIAIDSAGGVYVTGETFSTDFPTQDAYQTDQGETDAFVTKLYLPLLGNLTPAYSTYLGGGGDDFARWDSVAVDSAGAAYVTGQTDSTDFPTQDRFQGDQGGTDAFVTKVDPDDGGTVTLAYSTYLAGGDYDQGLGIATDSEGAAYVTGLTASANFPTQDPFQGNQPGSDAFVTRLGPDSGGPVTLAYSTYLGGAKDEGGQGIAVDSSGAAYVTGFTPSSDFPTVDQLQGHKGDADAFVAKLAPDSSAAAALAYSTYLGGTGADYGNDVAVDSAGNAYVTGNTDGTFPTADPFQGDQGGYDAFVAKLSFEPPPAADTDPPETTITKGPKKKTEKRKAKFRFASDEPGSSFECKLDKRGFEPCDGVERLKVKRRKHTFRVRATDAAGNTDPTPAKRKWKVKRKR